MQTKMYSCWLAYSEIEEGELRRHYAQLCGSITTSVDDPICRTAREEWRRAVEGLLGEDAGDSDTKVIVELVGSGRLPPSLESDLPAGLAGSEGYALRTIARTGGRRQLAIAAGSSSGLLYGVFHLLRLMRLHRPLDSLDLVEEPRNELRLLNHWDNADGSIERGYAGESIFFRDGRLVDGHERIEDYARLCASVGINGIALNNVNVRGPASRFIVEPDSSQFVEVATLFRRYGIRIYLSVNFAAPIEVGGLETADPLDDAVAGWWRERTAELYRSIPDFGGFLVKADSEGRPGPFSYGRTHADGANMLADVLAPHGGLLIWRCFVYNSRQDWRDRSTDRARAAYDHFLPLDGDFRDNVLLQIKNGPVDFQVREPVSPLFGALTKTNVMLELQITQEYTGQQRHLCYLVPQWKEVLDFATYASSERSDVASIVSGRTFERSHGGFAGVANIGDDECWTGHPLAQANLYGFARLAWNPRTPETTITDEWVRLTFGHEAATVSTISEMLLDSWRIYESYTAPLGVGWMVKPGIHYGPDVDGYEYSRWGTYHFADRDGLGVDRSVRSGSGYAAQYEPENASRYESLSQCPDELLLFFHHVAYTHRLRSGKSVIQHIYDSHFDGAQAAERLLEKWKSLQGAVDDALFDEALARFEHQAAHAREWRDIINTYFFRKSGIPDARGRTIYP